VFAEELLRVRTVSVGRREVSAAAHVMPGDVPRGALIFEQVGIRGDIIYGVCDVHGCGNVFG
jgi:hypothetical protein